MAVRGRALMVQGCTSNAGKSYLVAGLCRLYANRGVRVAPFKAQNMSNNAGVTPDGLEMGRAQLLQAQAARVTADVRMNPVLVKPEGETRSQVVVLGSPAKEISRLPWTARKAHLWDAVRTSLHDLLGVYDLTIIEGAGSPAEVNLKAGDIVNMRVAREARAHVLLAVDIDRGGAFAHLLGTWACFDAQERALLKGFILNKFRGDPALLGDGMAWLRERTGIPTVGVVPYLKLPLPDEDAFSLESAAPQDTGKPMVAILRTPYLSNFDEFDPLLHEDGVQVRWVEHPDGLEGAQAVILPGSKSVAADLLWLRQTGLAASVARLANDGVPVLGICGGFQMLGHDILDPHGVEGPMITPGLGLLDVRTELAPEKTRRLTRTKVLTTETLLDGYEIRHGVTQAGPSAIPYLADGLGYQQDNVVGAYVHGLFENTVFRQAFLRQLKVQSQQRDWQRHVDQALDTLAAHLEEHLDTDAIDQALNDARAPRRQPDRGKLMLITGGARSGKSIYAEALARHFGGSEVTYFATLEPNDDEMKRRIARHQERRPEGWQTVEATRDLAAALATAPSDTVLIDCLSGFVSNILLEHEARGEEAIVDVVLAQIHDLIQTARASQKIIIIVTNEVGSGVVPAYPLGRWYRDALGRANQQVAHAADAVSLVTVGIPRTLKGTLPELKE